MKFNILTLSWNASDHLKESIIKEQGKSLIEIELINIQDYTLKINIIK